eukprot:scaffold16593_cov50-Skeletonema_dohrnii-CCMP3373.AAC.1
MGQMGQRTPEKRQIKPLSRKSRKRILQKLFGPAGRRSSNTRSNLRSKQQAKRKHSTNSQLMQQQQPSGGIVNNNQRQRQAAASKVSSSL